MPGRGRSGGGGGVGGAKTNIESGIKKSEAKPSQAGRKGGKLLQTLILLP